MNNILDNLIAIETVRPRRMGYTTQMVNLVRENQGCLLTHSVDEATRIRNLYNVNAVSISTATLRGTKGPYFCDSTAFIAIHHEVTRELERKDKEIEKLKQELSESNAKIRKAEGLVEKLKELFELYDGYY